MITHLSSASWTTFRQIVQKLGRCAQTSVELDTNISKFVILEREPNMQRWDWHTLISGLASTRKHVLLIPCSSFSPHLRPILPLQLVWHCDMPCNRCYSREDLEEQDGQKALSPKPRILEPSVTTMASTCIWCQVWKNWYTGTLTYPDDVSSTSSISGTFQGACAIFSCLDHHWDVQRLTLQNGRLSYFGIKPSHWQL